jgi:hypothetical protein
MSVIRALRKRSLAVVLVAAVAGCTDAATRVANDLERGARQLRASRDSSLTVDHAPQQTPDGCPSGYTLQLSRAAGLLVWCQDSIGGPSTSSHITTSHLAYVQVPRTYIVHKRPGEHAFIELSRNGDDIDVTGLH